MRVLILSFYFRPDLCAGSFRTSALLEELLENASNDIHFDVVTTLPNRYSSFNAESEEIEIQDRLTIHRIKIPNHQSGMLDQSKAFLHFTREVLKIVKNNQYDLVFATSSRLMTAWLGAWVARIKGASLYLDIRDIFVDTIGDILSPKVSFIVSPILSLIEGWAFRRADKINLVSKGFEDYFRKRYPNQQYSWFTNGIDEEFINLSPNEVSSTEVNLPIKILYAGNFGEGQGLHEIIPEMAHRLAGRAEFELIGDGGRKQELQDSIDKFNLKNVKLLPPVARVELIKAYKSADILFLHLNDYQAFRKVLPSKVFEYASMGKPILAGVSGYAADFIKSEITNAAVFPPCNAKESEKAFFSLDVRDSSREDFCEKFSRKRIMSKMSEDILNLCSRK